MRATRLTLAVLSLLVLGAHFLRRGAVLPTVLCVALAGVAFVAQPWAVRLTRLALAVGAALWVATLLDVVRQRQAGGEPWLRSAVILGAVGLAALVAAVLPAGTTPVAPPRAAGDPPPPAA